MCIQLNITCKHVHVCIDSEHVHIHIIVIIIMLYVVHTHVQYDMHNTTWAMQSLLRLVYSIM